MLPFCITYIFINFILSVFAKMLMSDISIPPSRLLPIKICDKIQQRKFVNLVDEILLKKEKGEDMKYEENQIDQLVYELYDLTEEEIKVVEGN